MASRRSGYAVLLAACTAAACTSDGGTSDGESPLPFEVVTYNAGLLAAVGHVEQRLPRVMEALAAVEADLLCVQEVWEREHWSQLVEANAQRRPHVSRIPDDPGVVGQCSPDEFNPLEACAADACASAPALVPCVVAECPGPVAALGGACVQCLLEHASDGSFEAIRRACVGKAEADDGGVPSPEERSYVSGGSYGIGLLSSLPLAAHDQRKLDSSTVRRAILYARLDDTPIGAVHVFCTHLGAILPGVKYEGSYGSWAGENARHSEDLIAFVSQKASEGEPVLILGDLNNGPQGEDIAASEPASYAKFPAAGFADPFLDGPTAACTFCVDNPLVNPRDEGAQAALDHILIRGPVGEVTVERIFDQLIDIDAVVAERDGGAGGPDAGASTTLRVGLSDHYGLRGSFVK